MSIEQRLERLLRELPVRSRGGRVAGSVFDDAEQVLCSQLGERLERSELAGEQIGKRRSCVGVVAERELVFGDLSRIATSQIVIRRVRQCVASLPREAERVVGAAGSAGDLLQLIPATKSQSIGLGGRLGLSIDDGEQFEIRRLRLQPAGLLEVRIGRTFERARTIGRARDRRQQTNQADDQGA